MPNTTPHKDEAYAEKAQAHFEQLLKGKTLKAFGPTPASSGSNPTAIPVTVRNIHVTYADKKAGFVSVDVYLDGYDPEKTGIIYTDETFIASLRETIAREGLLNSDAISYSEAGLQHSNAVNLDVAYSDLLRRAP